MEKGKQSNLGRVIWDGQWARKKWNQENNNTDDASSDRN